MATNLQFLDFVWPNNPETYRITFHRDYKIEATATGIWTVNKGARLARKIECKGFFYGDTAYEQFLRLSNFFFGGSTGSLIHPEWNMMQAFIAELEVLEKPREGMLEYRILFVELPNIIQ